MTILTTHVGSLPRGDELAQLLLKQDHGEAVDETHFEQVVQAAIDQAVQKQAEAGVGIMSDGELGKVGYATYITQRLEGFGGHVDRALRRKHLVLADAYCSRVRGLETRDAAQQRGLA